MPNLRGFSKEQLSRSDYNKFVCTVQVDGEPCLRIFENGKRLSEHRRFHYPEYWLTCGKKGCKVRTTLPSNMNWHWKNIHKGEKSRYNTPVMPITPRPRVAEYFYRNVNREEWPDGCIKTSRSFKAERIVTAKAVPIRDKKDRKLLYLEIPTSTVVKAKRNLHIERKKCGFSVKVKKCSSKPATRSSARLEARAEKETVKSDIFEEVENPIPISPASQNGSINNARPLKIRFEVMDETADSVNLANNEGTRKITMSAKTTEKIYATVGTQTDCFEPIECSKESIMNIADDRQGHWEKRSEASGTCLAFRMLWILVKKSSHQETHHNALVFLVHLENGSTTYLTCELGPNGQQGIRWGRYLDMIEIIATKVIDHRVDLVKEICECEDDCEFTNSEDYCRDKWHTFA